MGDRKRKAKTPARAAYLKKVRLSRRGEHGRPPLAAGQTGVLCTVGGKAEVGKALREVYGVLEQYLLAEDDDEADTAAADVGIEDALEAEIATLKNEERPLRNLETGVRGVLFVGTPPHLDAVGAVHRLFSDCLASGTAQTRFCSRLLPITHTCRATLEAIVDTARTAMTPRLLGDDAQPCSFAIGFRARHTQKLDKAAVIDQVADLALKAGKGHTVDLGNPDVYVAVEVLREVCCFSLLTDYTKFRRYNLQQLLQPKPEPKEAPTPAPAPAPAPAEAPTAPTPS